MYDRSFSVNGWLTAGMVYLLPLISVPSLVLPAVLNVFISLIIWVVLSSIFIRSYSVCSLQFCDMSFWGNCKYTSCLFVLLTCLLTDILYVISEQINDDDDDDIVMWSGWSANCSQLVEVWSFEAQQRLQGTRILPVTCRKLHLGLCGIIL